MAVSKKFLIFGVICALILVVTFVGNVSSASLNIKERSIDAMDKKKEECHRSSPCGWTIYEPFTRFVSQFISNTCGCPAGTTCQKTDDDLSVSAYVHRCRPGVADPDTDLQNVSS